MALRKTFHRLIFWIHLIVGVTAGLVILSMAITGILISFEKQIAAQVDKRFQVQVPENAKVLSVEDLMAKAQAVHPDLRISGVVISKEASDPATLSIGRETRYYANPYTGEVLGEGDTKFRGFFKAVTSWHRYLTGAGLTKDAGKAVTGVANLVFFFLLVSGIYLWWPKHWRLSNLKAITVFSTKLKGRARDWNWHNVFGFWAAFPLLLVISTGMVFSYPWANNLIFTLTGNEPPPQRQRAGGPGSSGGQPQAPPVIYQLEGLSTLIDQVKDQHEGWNRMTIRMPHGPDNHMDVIFDHGNGLQPHKIHTYEASLESKKIELAKDSFQNANWGRKIRMWVRYTHTGELFGIPGQILAALTSIAAIFLVYTGFALSIRRLIQSRKRKKLHDYKVELNEAA